MRLARDPAARGRGVGPVRNALLAILLASISGGAALDGCALRDRANPLDPRNGTTHGNLAGFNAIAGDHVVIFRWVQLTQQGVMGYRVDRWLPGEAPHALPGASYAPYVSSAEDLTVGNDTTYVYRLVALFASGDSAASPPDTATPGPRRTMVLVASLPGVAGLSPDARDIVYADPTDEPFHNLDLDSTRGIFWMTQFDRGLVTSRGFESIGAGTQFDVYHPVDIAITTVRGVVWVAQPEFGRVLRFGAPDTLSINGLGPVHAVEANSSNATLWIGSDDGRLFHTTAATGATLESWTFPGPVNPIGVDEPLDVAWVAVRVGDLFDLYRVPAGSPGPPQLVRAGLVDVTDIAVEPETHSAWVSERGAPLAGAGRLTRFGPAGEVLATVTSVPPGGGIEPYALSIEPGTRDCWVTDLKSDRLIEFDSSGAVIRRSPALGVPYGVRVYRP
ncbi:MAG: hypothetical protein ACM3PF_15055 [Bacteroidota bacterium]